MTMLNKDEFAKVMSSINGESNIANKKNIDCFIKTLETCVGAGNGVDFRGTLKLEIEKVEERTYPNLQDRSKPVTKLAHMTVKAKLGKGLKDIAAGLDI